MCVFLNNNGYNDNNKEIKKLGNSCVVYYYYYYFLYTQYLPKLVPRQEPCGWYTVKRMVVDDAVQETEEIRVGYLKNAYM